MHGVHVIEALIKQRLDDSILYKIKMIFQSALTFQDPPATCSNYHLNRVYQPPPGSTSHPQGQPENLRVNQPPPGSTSHPQGLPAIFRVYQPPSGVPATLRVYQPPPGSTSHLQGLPATSRVYQPPSGSTIHLQDLQGTLNVCQLSI